MGKVIGNILTGQKDNIGGPTPKDEGKKSGINGAIMLAGSDCFSVANYPILAHMVTFHLIPEDIAADYEVHEWRNATGILQTAHLNEWQDIIDTLRAFQFRRSELLKGGGGKSIIAKRIDSFLAARQWKEKKFATKTRPRYV
jgi:hypothetical protein